MDILFIADIFVKEHQIGGGEKSNDEFIKVSREFLGHNIVSINSYLVTIKTIKKYVDLNYKFIIANFICLDPEVVEYISNNCDYIIIEHDHKYLSKRNPGLYKDFIAPKSEIRFEKFYRNAKKIICQSKLHKEIMKKNLEFENIKSLGGNFWPDEELDYILNIKKEDKREVASIMNFSSNLSKGTDLAIKYCIDNKIKYSLMMPMPTKEFLSEISKNKYFVFIPKTPETFSRVIAEAKMLGIQIKTIRKLIGACSEEWWDKYSPEDLLKYLRNNKINFANKILDSFNE